MYLHNIFRTNHADLWITTVNLFKINKHYTKIVMKKLFIGISKSDYLIRIECIDICHSG